MVLLLLLLFHLLLLLFLMLISTDTTHPPLITNLIMTTSAVFKAKLGGAWIHIHKPLQAMAVATALCGFGVIYLTVDEVGGKWYF